MSSQYKLNDEDRKWLTEFLGECWHEWNPEIQNGIEVGFGETYLNAMGLRFCVKCDYRGIYGWKRSFATPQDAHDLAVKLVEVGEWEGFEEYSNNQWRWEPMLVKPAFIAWLYLNDSRFCCLASEFLKGEKMLTSDELRKEAKEQISPMFPGDSAIRTIPAKTFREEEDLKRKRKKWSGS